MKAFLGLDVGAVSTNLAVLDAELNVLHYRYIRTAGFPISSIRRCMESGASSCAGLEVAASGTTGSGRRLAAALIGADAVKNEITANAAGCVRFLPRTRTIIEIGGQDSKLILVKNGAVVDFAMNTVCAAGTGSFLDYQAGRMGITIEEFADLAANSSWSARISARCAVFAETDIIEKQQQGADRGAIARGLCEALARNFLSSVAAGRAITPPVVFQGGVASNKAVKEAFERELGFDVTVPRYHDVMGAIGAAIIASRRMRPDTKSLFRGFGLETENITTGGFECDGCSNACEILEIYDGDLLVSRWGSLCGKWDLEE
jgi:predicted CoA-substrate-specific enzyme activase